MRKRVSVELELPEEVSLLASYLGTTFKPETAIYPLVFGLMLVFLFIALPDYKTRMEPTDFFLFGRELRFQDYNPTFVATNVGLSTSIIFSSFLGYSYGWSALLLGPIA